MHRIILFIYGCRFYSTRSVGDTLTTTTLYYKCLNKKSGILKRIVFVRCIFGSEKNTFLFTFFLLTSESVQGSTLSFKNVHYVLR